MTDRIFGVLDGALVLVVVLTFCVWQLISVNREIAKDKAVRPPESPESAGHPVGEHRLDDR